jgi:hypothetical protein
MTCILAVRDLCRKAVCTNWGMIGVDVRSNLVANYRLRRA